MSLPRQLASRTVLIVAVAAGLAPALARRAAAQAPQQAPGAQPAAGAVSGTVRDSATGHPVAGAAVVLRDSAGRTVAQALTNESGRYRLTRSAAARHLRVLRLGFRPADVPLTAGGAVPAEIAIMPVPALLAPVQVTAAGRCPRRANTPAALGLLEQVRAGLLATVVARTEQPAVLTVLSYQRQYDAQDDGGAAGDAWVDDGGRIVRQIVHVQAGTAAAAPFGASRAGASFVADGFRRDSAGASRFFAPDAETLVDDGFVAGYCFRVVDANPSRPHEVGLGFAAPKSRAGRTDVDGVLWVDTVARAVRSLSFRYVDDALDPRVLALRPGGRISFRQMPTGVAFVDRWALRLVSGQMSRDPNGGTNPTRDLSRTFGDSSDGPRLVVHEVGGELASVAWPDGRSWRAPLGTLRLQLTDPRGRPAAGVVARLDSTDYAGTADSLGVVEVANVLPGPYTVTAADPRLAAGGAARPATLRFVSARDSTVEARLTVETAAEAAQVVAVRNARAIDSAASGAAPNGASGPGGLRGRQGRDSSSVAIGDGKSIERLFAGRFPGVSVVSVVGGGLHIRVRGPVVGGRDPLYVVDGSPLPAGTGGIVYLNPNDIERIEVLKNPADVAVYGVRGGDGVIKITTYQQRPR